MIGLYIRVSTVEQSLNGHSLAEQEERLIKYCDALNLGNYKLYKDAGFSGGNMNRPALQELIKDMPKLDKVIVYKLDRLSRSQKDTLYLIEDVFLKNGVDFISMTENLDTSSAFGIAMIGILSSFAQLERNMIKERMSMGRYARAKQGLYTSSKPPIGYDYVKGELVTDEFEKSQIKAIYDRYLQGYSIKRIVKELNDSGMYHKYGKWISVTVRSVLQSKLYLGYSRYHDDWYKGTHEPFVTEEQFEDVQKIMKRRTDEHKNNSRSGKVNSYLGGLLYCAKCGAKYSKLTYQSNNTKYSYYVCNSRSKKTPHLVKDVSCRNKNWKMSELDEIIFNEIRKLVLEPDYIEPSDNSDVINTELDKINDQIRKLMDLYSIDGIPFNVLTDKIHDLNDQRAKLESELVKDKLTPAETQEIAESFDDILSRGDFDEIRSIITLLIDRIELGDDITIHWNF